MKFVRSHQRLLAWMLSGLILLSGVACSLGHGQVMTAFAASPDSELCGDLPVSNASAVSVQAIDSHSHALIMQLALFDCAFAAKLTGTLITLSALAWLLRALHLNLQRPERLAWAGRYAAPGRLPQAP